jgi:predicted N-acetyltransferase YhbS
VDYLADHPALVPDVAAWLHGEWLAELGWSRADVAQELGRRLSRAGLPLALVARAGGTPVGTASLTWETDPAGAEAALLAGVYVVPAWRSRGVASRLCRRARAEARRLALPRLCLYTVGHARFYERLGWGGATDAVLEVGGRCRAVTFMECPLAGTARGPRPLHSAMS